MSDRVLRIGARTSRLARHQAGLVLDAIRTPTEFVGVRTSGDLDRESPIADIGVTGVFTRELERALLDGEIDAAVHSLKDLATTQPEGLRLGAVLSREDPRDALVVSTTLRAAENDGEELLAVLPSGAAIGTSSLRRCAFLLRLRPDLRIVPIRGNVPSRLERLESGPFDAIVLAAAGLRRLGLNDAIYELLPPATFPPAPGQGAIAVQVRADDADTTTVMRSLEHPATAAAVAAERAFLHRIEGGCQVPAGALAEIDGKALTLTTLICSPDGMKAVAASAAGAADEATAVGLAAAERALLDGGDLILAALRSTGGAP